MKTLLKTISLLSVLMLTSAMLTGCIMPYKTGSTEVGVRTVKWSLTSKKGVEEKVYQPGTTHFFVPFLTDWNTFDTRLQNLEMTKDLNRGDRRGQDQLRFKTIDGNDIDLDVVISYRINPEAAPMILQDVATNDEELKESIVRTITRSKPRDIFGELTTEDFYVSTKRNLKAEEVQDKLNEILEPYGVIVERVGTRDYSFNAAYQAAIQEKKVADQEVERIKSETRATEAEYRTKVAEAQAEIAKIKAAADGEYERAVISADAYFEQQKLLAEAILAEAKAEATAVKEMNAALAGSGGEAMVKLAIAEALQGKRIVMLPMGGGGNDGGLDLRTTDVNALLDLYGIKALAGQ